MSSSPTPPLGRLEPVDLREAWVGEATDFTPWLAQPDNIALLGEAVGIGLEVEAVEKEVGPFRADILCRDTLDDHFVLIENQLEPTDHTHLGQLLTYAAGLEAVTIIWIAKRIRDEHRAALDWLNNATTSGFNFFGLEVELWMIGDSAKAPKFSVVCKPNDWTTEVRQHAHERQLTEDQQLRLDFWTEFHRYLEDAGKPLILSRPSYGSYATSPVGRSGFRLVAGLQKNGRIARVYLQISGPNKQNHYRLIREGYQQVVDVRLAPLVRLAPSGKLKWRDLLDAKESQISLDRASNLADRGSWRELHEWVANALETMRDLFVPIIAVVDSGEGEPDVEQWGRDAPQDAATGSVVDP